MAERPFWNDIEGASAAEVRALEDRKLAGQIDYLFANSSFYQRKLGDAGLKPTDIRSVRDLRNVPFTRKSELRESLAEAPPLGHHGIAPICDVVQIQASSGTTGAPSYVGVTHRDLDSWCEMQARTMYAGGILPGDLVMHATSLSKGFVGGVPVFQSFQYMKVCDIPIGAEAGTERLLAVIRDLKPNVLYATPHFAVYLAERVPDVLGMTARELSVRKLSVGGEPGGGIPAVRAKMEELWDADAREILGGTDFGIAYWGECEDKSGMHFTGQGYIVAEIIDPVTEEVLEPEQGVEGELVYSAIDRQASALLRFRSGDRVLVTGTSCPCGRTSYKLRCVGRTDDMLIVKGINVFPSAVQDVVTRFGAEVTGLIKVVVDFDGHTTQDALKIKVECAQGLPVDRLPGLKRDLENSLRDSLVFRPEVTLVPAGTFAKPGQTKVSMIERVQPSGSRA
ncbi:MAG: AMP-binding protein [Actinobacteria bacterium]|nr:AMP-binding protein [Actinomycetota bacterium]